MFLYQAPDTNEAPSYQELGKSTFMDVAAAQYETFKYEDLSNSRRSNLEHEKWHDVVRAQEAMPELFTDGSELELIEGSGHAIDILNQARTEAHTLRNKIRLADYEDIVLPNLEKLKEANGEIRGLGEIDAHIAKRAAELRHKYEQEASRADAWDSFWGTLGGGVVGAMRDPINIALMPVGMGATSLAGGLLRGVATAFGKSMVMGMVAEAPIQAVVYDYKKEIESPYDLGDAIFNIVAGGIGEGILSGVGHGILRGAKKVRDSFGLTSEQEAVIDYVRKLQEIADENQVENSAQLQAHVEALVEVQKDIQDGRVPDLSAINDKVSSKYLQNYLDDIDISSARIQDLEVQRAALVKQLDEKIAADQAKLAEEADFKLTRGQKKQVKAAQAEASSARPKSGEEQRLTPEGDLGKLRNEQQHKWVDEDSRKLLVKSERAKAAQAELKASRKEHGDQEKIKADIEQIDTELEVKTEYLEKTRKARDE